jgi:hypothetical protein
MAATLLDSLPGGKRFLSVSGVGSSRYELGALCNQASLLHWRCVRSAHHTLPDDIHCVAFIYVIHIFIYVIHICDAL